MRPRTLGIAAAALLVIGAAIPAVVPAIAASTPDSGPARASAASPAKAPAARKSHPRGVPVPISVSVAAGVLSIQAMGATTSFGPDETLIVRAQGGGYQVLMSGFDAVARLRGGAGCTPNSVAGPPVLSVSCSARISSINVDYTALTTDTQTSINVALPTTFQGGSGGDYFQSGGGSDNLSGGDGVDLIFGDDEDGPYGDDTITGGLGKDEMFGYGGNNTLYAKDGIADTAVECADNSIAGSSGSATWDANLDKPVLCAAMAAVPEQPTGLKASVGPWKGSGATATVDVTFSWNRPTASQPPVTSYLLEVFGSNTIPYVISDPNATSKTVNLSVVDVIPVASGEAIYAGTLTPSNASGTGPSAQVSFTSGAEMSAPSAVKASRLNDIRQGIRVSWTAPPDSPVATVTGYRVERRVPAELRQGPEWLPIRTVDAATTFVVDPCLPPNLAITYRVIPIYRVFPSQAFEGPLSTALASAPGYYSVPPAPTSLSVDLNGIFTINNRPIQIMLEGKSTGQRVDPGQCFGLAYQYSAIDKKAGTRWVLSEEALTRVSNGASTASYPSLYVSGTSAGSTLGFELSARWTLDTTWANDYGGGWNVPLVADYVRASASSNATSASVTSANDVYAATTGASVTNLAVKRDAGTFDYRVSWTPPPATDPNTTNIRGYEVCSYSTINSTYTGLATNPKFPTYTTKMHCRLVGASTTSTTIEQGFWCTSLSTCALSARNFFVQVRPWVGLQRPQSVGTSGTVWTDWNRNTFVTARSES